MNVKNTNFLKSWKKKLAAALLPISLLMAMPVSNISQDGQNYVFAEAREESTES